MVRSWRTKAPVTAGAFFHSIERSLVNLFILAIQPKRKQSDNQPR